MESMEFHGFHGMPILWHPWNSLDSLDFHGIRLFHGIPWNQRNSLEFYSLESFGTIAFPSILWNCAQEHSPARGRAKPNWMWGPIHVCPRGIRGRNPRRPWNSMESVGFQVRGIPGNHWNSMESMRFRGFHGYHGIPQNPSYSWDFLNSVEVRGILRVSMTYNGFYGIAWNCMEFHRTQWDP